MPLPKPSPGERESEFIARCTIDAKIENEFPTLSQRLAVCYSLYEGKQQKAANYDTIKYYQGFERQLEIAERQELAKVFRYHLNQYDQAIKQFLETGKTQGWTELFKKEDLDNIYTNIYVNIGMRVSEWYTKNFERYNKKFDITQYRDIFAYKFAALANQIAGARVSSIQDNRKQVLVKELQRAFSDPEFQALNEREAQRILRSRFKGISKYQAERIVRTESVAAANFATSQAAGQMFNEQDLMKEWITAEDGRVRRIPRDQASHRAMNGVTIPATEKFKVPTKSGIELMQFPGDPNASPANVINCRCTVAYVPREAAEATMTIQGFGVQDLGQIEEVGENFGLIVNTVAQVAEEVVEKTRDQVIRERIEENRPEEWGKITRYASSRTELPLKLNDEFLEFVNLEGYRFNFRGSGAHHSFFSKEIKLAKTDWVYRDRTIYHEFGHHIHDNLKLWDIYGDNVNPIFNSFFWDMQDLAGQVTFDSRLKERQLAAIRKTIPKLEKGKTSAEYWEVKKAIKVRHKDIIDKIGDREFEEQWHSLADFFGAITKNEVGWGHKDNYYDSVRRQYAEMFAHMSEWRFGNHDLVKAAFPEVYEKAMKVMEEIFEEFRKANGY